MSDAVGFAILSACLLALWFGWWVVSGWLRTRRQKRWLVHLVGAIGGAFAVFGAFCVVGGLLMPGAMAAVGVGFLVLAPYGVLWWRTRPGLDCVVALPKEESTQPINDAVNAASNGEMPRRLVPEFFGMKWEEERIKAGGGIQKQAQEWTAKNAAVRRATAPTNDDEHGSSANAVAFDYANADGEITHRRVLLKGNGRSGDRRYIEGVDLDRHAMRTFRLDRIIGKVKCESDGQALTAEAVFASLGTAQTIDVRPAPVTTAPPRRTWETAVFFAGFGVTKRAELEDLAEAAGWQVRSRISGTVDYVVIGAMAGRAQISTAEEHGITVIDEDAFRALV